jgi:4-amino-4-deoxy-L-arabinose transferase-like glycosyltransferase
MTAMARFVAGAALIGLLLRLGFGLWYWVDKPLMKDEQEYLLLSIRVATGQGFTYPAAQPSPGFFERPPGFVVLLSSVLMATRDPLVTTNIPQSLADLPPTSSGIPTGVTVVQCLLGTIVIVLVAALAHRAGGERAANVAAAAAALYPPMAWVSGYMLSEPLYSALALGAIWLLLKAGDTGVRRAWWGLIAGVVAGAALLTKEAMIFFLPLAALWLLWHRQRQILIALAAGVALVVLPWVARNYSVHSQFILTAAHGGVTLWTGNNPLARGEGDLAANPIMGQARRTLEAQHPGLSNQEMDDVYYAEVRRFVREHPGQWLVLEAKKVFYTVVPIGPSYTLHSDRYFLASLISYGLLAPVALIGLCQLFRRAGPSPLWALGLLALSSVIVCLIFFPQERFRIPVLDPSAIVAAAVALSVRRS